MLIVDVLFCFNFVHRIYAIDLVGDTNHSNSYQCSILLPLLSPFPFHSSIAVQPSPVRNLTVDVDFNQVMNNKITANLSWIGPEKPYGKILRYKVVLSSPTILSIESKEVNVKVCYISQRTVIIIIIHSTPIDNDIHCGK